MAFYQSKTIESLIRVEITFLDIALLDTLIIWST